MAKRKKRKKNRLPALISDKLVVKQVRNQTVVSLPNEPAESDSPAKEESKGRFKEAGLWATAIMKKPGMKELYSKGINDHLSNARTVALTDYLNQPKIHYIGLKEHTGAIGDHIRIKATDDFQVTSVDVFIKNKEGQLLENGPAVRYKRKPKMWVYTLTVANPQVVGTVIEVIAMDRPGNKAVKRETIEKVQVPSPTIGKKKGATKAIQKKKAVEKVSQKKKAGKKVVHKKKAVRKVVQKKKARRK